MKQKFSRAAALSLAVVTAGAAILTGCGGKKTDQDPESFTYFIGSGVDSKFVKTYNDLPAVKYWLDKEWKGENGDTKIRIDFTEAPADSLQDNLNTMISTGEYPEVLTIAMSSRNASALYDDGIAIDLTEYVDKYMPNYKKWMKDHPTYASQMQTDGKIIQLFTLADSQEPPWGGWVYRRDWLVKYGTNPQTGAPFTGGWTDDAKTAWKDDVVFPSGGSDPIYISDWEWMFDIFQKALADQGITDGYAFQNYYTGYEGTGDLNCGFGGGMFGNYIGTDGKAHCGYIEEGARSYLECMTNWYAKGWMNQNFDENSSDTMFFQVDTPAVFGGKVGLWYGLQAQLGRGLDTGDNPLTKDSCCYGAAQPINDKYGDPSTQNVKPRNYYATPLAGAGIIITDKAEGKDIGALCNALDYLYAGDGAMLRRYGFSADQQKEVKDTFYHEHGFDNGAYTVTKDENGKTIFKLDPNLKKENGLSECLGLIRLVGTSPFEDVDQGFSDVVGHSVEQQMLYPVDGNLLTEPITTQLSSDQSSEWGTINANLGTYLSQEVPSIIKGQIDISDDAAWDKYVSEVKEQNAGKYAEIINDILAENAGK